MPAFGKKLRVFIKEQWQKESHGAQICLISLERRQEGQTTSGDSALG